MYKIRFFLLLVGLALGGCASTHNNPKDPFESFNRGVYKFNDTLDKAVLKPVAQGYNNVVPSPAKTAVTNFFSNLNDVKVTLNDLLQFKIVQGITDLERVIFNSSFGLFGLIDMATPMGLEKHDEDFGQTLGYWGINSGPYLMLPFFGPSSVRDGIGLYVDSSTSMLKEVDHIPTRNELYAANTVSTRANLLDGEKILDEASIDRYSFLRDAYLQRRQDKVYDGSPPRQKWDDEDANAKTPDKVSANDNPESTPAELVESAPIAALVVASTAADSATAPQQPQPSVVRIWLAQRQGIN